MQSISLSKIFDMVTLFHIEIFAVIAAIFGSTCVAGMFVSRMIYTIKTKKHVDKIGEFGIAAENAKLTKIHVILTRMAIMFFSIAMLTIITYSIIFSHAVKYGAYGDFYKKNTLSEILYNMQHGFIDQSEDVPDDPKGCVIIFYKWGCEDCMNIHDELLTVIQKYDLFKTYFVSSRSDRGQELLSKYPVEHVPSGIYIYYDTSRGIDYQKHVLNDGTSLNEYSLDTLLSVQKYIRCFELPEQHKDDAMNKIPDEYTDCYYENTEIKEGGTQ